MSKNKGILVKPTKSRVSLFCTELTAITPNGGKNKEPELLASCYRKLLDIADSLLTKSVAFPNISTGVHHFPKVEAAQIAIATVKQFADSENKNIEEVIFVCFDDENYQLYESILGE